MATLTVSETQQKDTSGIDLYFSASAHGRVGSPIITGSVHFLAPAGELLCRALSQLFLVSFILLTCRQKQGEKFKLRVVF